MTGPSWQKYYRPLAVGEKLYIVPEWERDTAEIPAGTTRLLMNPGLTFGTGSHASTQLCLEGVEAHAKAGDLVLDLGCGSGILASAALCLGARWATGVDIDPKAVDVAYENAALNGIGRDRCRFLAGNVLADQRLVDELAQERADLVLANIVADVIIPWPRWCPGCWRRAGPSCAPASSTPGEMRWLWLTAAGLTVTGRREKNGWIALEATVK